MYFELKQELFDRLREICMETRRAEESMSVTRMLTRLMDLEGLPMHCPYHHFIVPAALLTQSAVFEKRDVSELSAWLDLAEERAKTVPAGFCGECGTCGSAVGIGMFLSIYTGATPKSVENWQQANEITGICLQKIAAYPGPRCCKRTSFLAVNEGVPYLNEKLGLEFTVETDQSCTYHNRNAECLEGECPFYEGGEAMRDTRQAIIVEAEKMIVISSPDIRQDKIDRLLLLIKGGQEKGVNVTVITTAPEEAVYGSADVCYELIREMQQAGINIVTKAEVEERFAVIDDELVWHGGMNLLGKVDIWDNLMRIKNHQVAAELLEIALGTTEEW